MVLASAGITDGRRATTHHQALAALRASGADVVEARMVDDGDLITCDGVTSGLDLALWLVARFAGAGAAEQVARDIEHERAPEVARA
jgi:transcriptional regulator GlxA family with amidase domain